MQPTLEMRGEIMRRWTCAAGFRLDLYESQRYDGKTGRDYLGYRFFDNGNLIFEGQDYGPSPMYSIDDDGAVAGLLSFLALRPGDTDDEYFEHYTPEQMAWAESRAEELSLYASDMEEAYAEACHRKDAVRLNRRCYAGQGSEVHLQDWDGVPICGVRTKSVKPTTDLMTCKRCRGIVEAIRKGE